MSANRNPKRPGQVLATAVKLADLLDFGPDTDTTIISTKPSAPSNDDVNARLLRLVKTLKELNARLDKINTSQF